MNFKLSRRSENNLAGVHPDLVKVVRLALKYSQIDFGITEGLRTEARQKQLVAAGASKTMKSRHLTGHAVDVVAYVDGAVRWDWALYGIIAQAFEKASAELGVPIIWGGSWSSFPDGPHFELDRRRYP